MTNDELDKKLIQALRGNRLKFHQIQVVVSGSGAAHAPYRQIDRRLQALRKKGVIEFSHGFGWRAL